MAVIGASRTPGKIGHEILRNIINFGFKGNIYPVNPHVDEVLGLRCFPSMREVPDQVDLAIISVPSRAVARVVDECGASGVKAVAVISSGFREIGQADLEKEVVRRARRYGMRLLGPNIFGLVYTPSKLNASFGPLHVHPGKVAFITQSGAIGISLMSWTILEHVGLSAVVSVGNKADVDDADLLEFFADDPNSSVILIYMEGLTSGRRFMEAALKATAKKPVITIKAGRTKRGSMAAASHTGSMAGSDEVYRAAFRQTGVLLASSVEEAFDWAEALVADFELRGENLLIITNGGGAGVLAADASELLGLRLMGMSPNLRKKFRALMPYYGSVENPVDLTATADGDDYYGAIHAAMGSDEVDAVIAIYCQTPYTDPTLIASRMIKAMEGLRAEVRKPLVICGIGGVEVEKALRMLEEAGIPAFPTPERAVMAMAALFKYYEYREEVMRKTSEN